MYGKVISMHITCYTANALIVWAYRLELLRQTLSKLTELDFVAGVKSHLRLRLSSSDSSSCQMPQQASRIQQNHYEDRKTVL